MANLQDTVSTYIAVWNEPDDAARLKLLEKCWAEKGVYSDPLGEATGREVFSQHIGALLKSQFAGHSLVLSSGIDAHHNFLRFSWSVYNPEKDLVLAGIDFGELDKDGLLDCIIGFFGPLPAEANA